MSFLIPKIVYGSKTLQFVYPPVQKPYLDDFEAKRHDSMTVPGLRESVSERIDTVKILQMDNVPWPNLSPTGIQVKQSAALGNATGLGVFGTSITLPKPVPAGSLVIAMATYNSGDWPTGINFSSGDTPTVAYSRGIGSGARATMVSFIVAAADIPSLTITETDAGAGGGLNLFAIEVSMPTFDYTGIYAAGGGLMTVTLNGLTYQVDATLNPHDFIVFQSPNPVVSGGGTVAIGFLAGQLQPGDTNSPLSNTGDSEVLGLTSNAILTPAAFPVPKIVYDSGSGPVTLNFTYPDTGKPYADWLSAQRTDAITSSGIRQPVIARVDVMKSLQVENVPWADLPAWSDFLRFAIGGGIFLFYPDVTQPIYSTWELSDDKFSPKFSARGLSKLTLNLRRVPGGPSSIATLVNLNDPTYGDTYNWQGFMQYALQGGTFQYFQDSTASAFDTREVVGNDWKPAMNVRGLSKFTIKLRLVPGGAFSL